MDAVPDRRLAQLGRPGRVRAGAAVPDRHPAGRPRIAIGDQRFTQESVLWDGAELVEFRTHVDGSIGQDRLLRARFGLDVPGGLPVYQTGLSVIGRPLGQTDVDVAEHTYTMDNPAHEWFGIGSTVRVALTARRRRAAVTGDRGGRGDRAGRPGQRRVRAQGPAGRARARGRRCATCWSRPGRAGRHRDLLGAAGPALRLDRARLQPA